MDEHTEQKWILPEQVQEKENKEKIIIALIAEIEQRLAEIKRILAEKVHGKKEAV